MSQYLGAAIGKHQAQLVREPLAVVLDDASVWLSLFPVIYKLDGSPVRNMAVFILSEDAIQHSRCGQKADMAAVQRRQRSAVHAALFPNQDSGCLIRRRSRKQILHFIQRNPIIG